MPARRIGFAHGLGPADVDGLAVRILDHHHVLAEARQGEVHALGVPEKLIVHTLEHLGLALATHIAAVDPVLDGYAHIAHVLAVGIPGPDVDILGRRAQRVVLGAQTHPGGLVVADHIVLGWVDLCQSRVVHQFGQLALVRQLAPGRGKLIRAGTGFVLVSVHGHGVALVRTAAQNFADLVLAANLDGCARSQGHDLVANGRQVSQQLLIRGQRDRVRVGRVQRLAQPPVHLGALVPEAQLPGLVHAFAAF